MSSTLHEGTEISPRITSPRRPALSASHVSKTFRLPRERAHTLKERAIHPLRKRITDDLHALDDVSFEIARGEFFGIVGRNGSGKSTLLKCLAGIYPVDSGDLEVNGRLAPFIELGVGFNPELTARDNAIINGIMLGLTRREAIARLDEIVAFAELEEFMELRLKNYSSGMHVRLAFAVAIQVDAEILLIDEVLAVGDASFQRKCYDEFTRLKEAGRTIVFVTHDMGAVERFCDRAMLLERGRMVAIGDSPEIAERYNELNFRRAREEARATGGPAVLQRDPVAAVIGARFENLEGKPVVHARQGAQCVARIHVHFHAATENPMFALALVNERGSIAFATSSNLILGETGSFATGEDATVRVHFTNLLSPGRYRLVASVTGDGSAENAYDLRDDIASIIVDADRTGGGVVDLPHHFEIQRR